MQVAPSILYLASCILSCIYYFYQNMIMKYDVFHYYIMPVHRDKAPFTVKSQRSIIRFPNTEPHGTIAHLLGRGLDRG